MSNPRDTIAKDLTSGSAAKKLLVFAAPLFASNMLQAVYNIVDMMVVGQYLGKTGMSAVAIGGETLTFLTFAAMGFSNAGQVIIAQYVGANQTEKLRRLIGTLLTFLTGIAVVISLLCLLFRNGILTLLNAPAVSRGYALDYTVVCCLGLVFIYGYNVVSAILRGMGDSRHPFVFISIATVLNIVLDILFVAVLGMEVLGAALATVIGQAVSFLTAIVYLYRNRERFGFDFKRESFAIDGSSLRILSGLGIPMALQFGAKRFSVLIVTAWINTFGVEYSAMQGAASKLLTVTILVCTSFTAAGSSMVGQSIGAGKYDRVKEVLKIIFWINFSVFTIFAAILLAAPNAIFGLFTQDASVLNIVGLFIPAAILNFYGAAARAPAFSLINGSGFSRLNLTVAILDGLIGRIGLSYLLGFACNLGCRGIWLGESLSGFIPVLLGGAYYLSGAWKTQKQILRKDK